MRRMWATLVALGIGLTLASSPARAAPIVFVEDDFPGALKAAQQRKVPLFVDAWAPWCHTCLFMREHVLSRPELGIHATSFVFLSIDTEKERNTPFLRRYPVESWPTLFVIDSRDESVVVRWVGTASVQELGRLLTDGRMAVGGRLAESKRDVAPADRLFGRGRSSEAAKAYRELLAAPDLAPERAGRLLLSLMSALEAAGEKEACLDTALAESGKLSPGALRAGVVGWGMACASADPAAERAVELRRRAEEAVSDPGLLADDRSSLYESIVDALQKTGDGAGAKGWAEKWWAFLGDESSRAKSPAARAAFDAHRMLAAVATGRPERVLPVLQKSGRELPQDYNPPARAAVVLRDLGRSDEALVEIDRALALAYGPRKLKLFDVKASILEKKGDGAGRIEAIKAALSHARSLPLSKVREDAIARLTAQLETAAPANAVSIVQAGEPVLRRRAAEVSPERIRSPEFQKLVASMVEAMRKAPGVGLAAPQIGVGERVIVLEDREELMAKLTAEEREERGRAPFPLTVIVNPVLVPVGEQKAAFFEGCLSVQGYTAIVERHAEVEVKGLDEKGEARSWRVKGWPARILQHELDHLDGKLYLDRMVGRSFSTVEKAKELFGGKPAAEIRKSLGE